MAKFLVLPKIGMNMEEGVIAEWLVKPGDTVKKDDIVLRAETDKAIQDIFATESGIVYKLLADVGDIVPCQGRIAVLVDEGEEYKEDAQTQESAQTQPDAPTLAPAAQIAASPAAKVQSGDRLRISPLARKAAEELHISLNMVHPAENGKRIVKKDVLRAAEQAKQTVESQEASGSKFVPYSHMRKVIAKNMRTSAGEKPRVSLACTIDCENLIAFRNKMKVKRKVGYNEIIAKACAQALKAHKEMNAVTAEDGYYLMDDINIGVAVDTERGLLVPVIRNMDKKGVLEIAENFEEIVNKAKSGKLSAAEMSGGTFTITNLGMFGVEDFNPIINGSECFILGIGCMKKAPVVDDDDNISVHHVMRVALNFDHAVFDGAAAAKLLKTISEYLNDPSMMLE